jgi:hypothetical protein
MRSSTQASIHADIQYHVLHEPLTLTDDAAARGGQSIAYKCQKAS